MNEMLDAILGLPGQLIKAGQFAAGIKIGSARNVFICGMGGSALPFELLYSLGDKIKIPVFAAREYNLPGYAGPEDFAVTISYSGNTEETLSCYQDAKKRGLGQVIIASGGKLKEFALADGYPFVEVPKGFQPRAAIGYLGGIILSVLKNSGLADTTLDLREAADFLKSGDQRERARSIAAKIGNKLPHIYSSRRLWSAAYKWKIAMNENAKREAFCNILPEMNHNEMQGFGSGGRHFPFCMFLADSEEHPGVARRMKITSGLIARRIGSENVGLLSVDGPSHLARLFSAIQLGDLVSLYMAMRDEIEVSPVPMVDELKAKLASSA